MHHIFQAGDGWTEEVLRDDSDSQHLQSAEDTKDSGLAGVAFIEYKRKNDLYTATLRFEEHFHNRSISVDAIVYRNNGNSNGHHKTLADALFSEEDEFKSPTCKKDAAGYAYSLQEKINWLYFPEKQ